MTTKLNFKQCLAIKPEQTKKRYSLGNNLLIETNSISKKGKKYFIGRYRVPNKKYTLDYQIGAFGEGQKQYTPTSAMKKWEEVLEWCYKHNLSPKDYKLSKKHNLITHLEKPTLIQASGEFLEVVRTKVKEGTHRDYTNKLNQILSLIDGDLTIDQCEIANRGKILMNNTLRKIAGGSKYDLENRCRFLLHRLFDYAHSRDWMTGGNPVEINRDFFIVASGQHHHPTIDWIDVPDFFQRLQHNACNAHKQTVLATKFMLLTFLRTGALVRLEWDFVDLEKKLITITGATLGLKRKRGKNEHIPHLIPITDEMESILNQVRTYNNFLGFSSTSRHPINERRKYIFPPIMDGKYPHLHPSAINDFLRDLGYKGRFRAHGWRRFALTNGIDVLKAESDVIRRQMGHLPEGKVLQAYDASERLDERRKFLDDWGKALVKEGLKVQED